MKGPYEKISPTAKLVAYLRTFTDIPFAKEIARESGAERAYKELAGEGAKSMVRFVPFWEARYKVTDRILTEFGMTQVLEIAAGLSPRGLVMTRNPDVVYVVTDLPQILDAERTITESILASSDSRRPNLHFRAANALDIKSLSGATTPFKHERPVAIVTEGLLPYLSRREKEILAGNIHALLAQYGGAWITSDVHTKQYFRGVSRVDEDVRERLNRISSTTERTLETNLFSNESDMKGFFARAGFEITEYPHSKVLEELSSVGALNLDQEETRKLGYVLRLNKSLILTLRSG